MSEASRDDPVVVQEVDTEALVRGPIPTPPAARPRSTRESVLKVLLVQESTVEAEFLQGQLSKALFTTHQVKRVVNVSEALSSITEERFDALLLDLALPDGGGLDALRRIQSGTSELALPIVVMTGREDEAGALEAMAAGAQDYLIKGDFQARNFIRIIQHAIERRRMEIRLEESRERELYLATHDRLTSLPNRYLFVDRLSQALHNVRRHRRWLAVLLLDLDRFNAINDSLGQSVGDQLLQVAGQRLHGCLRATDSAGRMDGDVFAVLLPDLSQPLDAAKVAQNIERRLAQPYHLAGRELCLTASIGIAVCPEDGIDAESLMGAAEAAMKTAKSTGGNSRRFYTSKMNASSTRMLTLEQDLRRAIEVDQEQLSVHLQPIVDGRTGGIMAAEVLMRWSHPTLGPISPGEFVPIAETRGLIIALGAWVLRTACQQIREWQDAGYPSIPLSVNVSPTQFWNADFLGLVMQTLLDTGADPMLLQLEVTEGCVMRDVDLVADALNAVQQLDVQTSIDDFGTGFSSLNLLRRLPLNSLKIDRSFVAGCPGNVEDATVTTAIIGLARNLGLRVVAEGVETEEQRRFFLDQGCSTMQGFLFSKPVTVDRFTRLVSAGRVLPEEP
jgi:diguanylate cyclase (GGDEF)-like protein